MRLLTKGFCGLTLLLSSAVVFAHCPLIGGYTLKSHGGYNCIYVSKKTVTLPFPPKGPVKCPAFTVTDSNYHLINCHHDIRVIKCVCTIRRN